MTLGDPALTLNGHYGVFAPRSLAERDIAKAIKLSVHPSVHLSVTLMYRDHMGRNSAKIISRLISLTIFTVRHYALHGLSHRNSVCPSVRLSVTLVDCVHMVRPTIMISSPYGGPIILVSGDVTFIPKFEWGRPELWR